MKTEVKFDVNIINKNKCIGATYRHFFHQSRYKKILHKSSIQCGECGKKVLYKQVRSSIIKRCPGEKVVLAYGVNVNLINPNWSKYL